MSALSLASLGVICNARSFSMASLGVFCLADEAAVVVPILSAGGAGYTHEIDERDVLDIVSLLIASGVLDDGKP